MHHYGRPYLPLSNDELRAVRQDGLYSLGDRPGARPLPLPAHVLPMLMEQETGTSANGGHTEPAAAPAPTSKPASRMPLTQAERVAAALASIPGGAPAPEPAAKPSAQRAAGSAVAAAARRVEAGPGPSRQSREQSSEPEPAANRSPPSKPPPPDSISTGNVRKPAGLGWPSSRAAVGRSPQQEAPWRLQASASAAQHPQPRTTRHVT
jgi:hypothetical protein